MEVGYISINGYNFSNLSDEDIKEIQTLEKRLNNKLKKEEEVILLAFNNSH